MIRLLYTRRHRRHEQTLDHIDALKVELGIKQARERYHAMPRPQRAAELWSASAGRSAKAYAAGVSAFERPSQ